MKPGDMIMNDFGDLAEVGEYIDYNPEWKTCGWMIVTRDTCNGSGGRTRFLPGYLIGGWRSAPMSWTPNHRKGGQLLERWMQRDNGSWYLARKHADES